MKKTILILTFISFVFMSFTNDKSTIDKNSDFIVLKINLDEAATNNWGRWNLTDCLKGLDFRVRNDGYNKYAKKYRWSIQFRNRYRDNIHFSYKAVAPSDKYEIRKSGRTTDRLHVNGNNGVRGSYYLVASGNSIYVYVNNIRIGQRDYGTAYYNCDR